eukprot:Pgem_evm1s1829
MKCILQLILAITATLLTNNNIIQECDAVRIPNEKLLNQANRLSLTAQREIMCRNNIWSCQNLRELNQRLIRHDLREMEYNPQKYIELYKKSILAQDQFLLIQDRPPTLYRGVSEDFFKQEVWKKGGIKPKCPGCHHSVKFHVREGNSYYRKGLFLPEYDDLCNCKENPGTATQFVSFSRTPDHTIDYALSDYTQDTPTLARVGFLLVTKPSQCIDTVKTYTSHSQHIHDWIKLAETKSEQVEDKFHDKDITEQWFKDADEILMDFKDIEGNKLGLDCMDVYKLTVLRAFEGNMNRELAEVPEFPRELDNIEVGRFKHFVH